jgi:hypothetical protein
MLFAEIDHLESDRYSLSVGGAGREFALKRCSPFQIQELAEAIRGRLESAASQ